MISFVKQILCQIFVVHVLQMPMKHYCGVQHQRSEIHIQLSKPKELNEGKQMRSDWYIPICSGKKDYVKIIINDHTQHKNQKLYSTEFY